MEFTIHMQVLLLVFLIALLIGGIANKTNFCTMGAVSDWVNMGDTGRLRAWLFAVAVAAAGLLVLETAALMTLPPDTLPPYRTGNFAWLRYILGGVMFGIGMTLGSGCGSKTLIRIGGGNLKSLVVFGVIAFVVYLMFTTQLFNVAFMSWIQPTVIELNRFGITSQDVGVIVSGLSGADPATMRVITGAIIVLALFWFVFKSKDFRGNFDNILGGAVIGLAVVAGWYITAGPMGVEWREYALFAPEMPSRVGVQSFTFIGPVGDTLRYLLNPAQLTLINFGVTAVFGVILGSFLYAVFSGRFRIEWFVSFKDFLSHAVGGVLMGFGGILAMGCTIGQGVTGTSTLALGSFIALGSMIFGSALTMKVQYYMLDEQGFWRALRLGLADLKLLPGSKAATA